MINPKPRLFLLYHELRPAGSKYSYVVDTKQFEQQADLFLHLRSTSPAHPRDHIRRRPHLQLRARSSHPPIPRPPGMVLHHRRLDRPEARLHGLERTAHTPPGRPANRRPWLEPHPPHALQRHPTSSRVIRRAPDTRRQARNLHHHHVSSRRPLQSQVLAACQQAGYTQVFTSITKTEPDLKAFTLGRLNVRGDMSTEWIANLFQPGNNLLAGLERQYKIKETAKTLLGDRIYEKLWSILNRQETDNDSGEPAAREDSAHHQ